MTDTLKVSTEIHAPQSEVYEFLCNFTGYAQYTDHITNVTQRGDGSEGTEYGLTLSWWKLSYTAWSRVIDLDPDDRITWRITKDIDAHGAWDLEPTDVDDPDVSEATRVVLTVTFDPDSANSSALSLPPLVSLSWVIEKARPLLVTEAKHVLARVIRDMEDKPRQPTLTIHTRPGSV